MSNEQPQIVVVKSTKSVGIAILLAFMGPIGMFYSTIIGGIVMLIVALFVGFSTFGLGLIFIWPICIIWSAMAAISYNKKLLACQN